eukprot:GEMP01012315.1.p1 GENE.GEMP01012315.1~~GEMP01012315.1.p1  ORF type:complete len:969 (+),score=234.39 GEMP01012315.1:45-2951(+)
MEPTIEDSDQDSEEDDDPSPIPRTWQFSGDKTCNVVAGTAGSEAIESASRRVNHSRQRAIPSSKNDPLDMPKDSSDTATPAREKSRSKCVSTVLKTERRSKKSYTSKEYGSIIGSLWTMLTDPELGNEAMSAKPWVELKPAETDVRYEVSPYEKEFRGWISMCKSADQVAKLIQREGNTLLRDPTGLAHALLAMAKFGLANPTPVPSHSSSPISTATPSSRAKSARRPSWRALCRAFTALCHSEQIPPGPDNARAGVQMISHSAQTHVGDSALEAPQDVLGSPMRRSREGESDDSSDVDSKLDFSYDNLEKFVKGPAIPSWIRSRSTQPRPLAVVLALQALEMKETQCQQVLDDDDLAFGAVLCQCVQPSGLYKVFLPQEITTLSYSLAKISRTALRPSVLAVFDLFSDLALDAFSPSHIVTLMVSFRLAHAADLGVPASWARFFVCAQDTLAVRGDLLSVPDIVRALRSASGIPGLPTHKAFYRMIERRVAKSMWMFDSRKLCSIIFSFTTGRWLDTPFFTLLARQVSATGMAQLAPLELCRLATSLGAAKCDCTEVLQTLAQKVESDLINFSPDEFAFTCTCFRQALDDLLLPAEQGTQLFARIAELFLSIPLSGPQLCQVVHAVTSPDLPADFCDPVRMRNCAYKAQHSAPSLFPPDVTKLFQAMARRQLVGLPVCRKIFEQCIAIAIKRNWHHWEKYLDQWVIAARELQIVTNADAVAFAKASLHLKVMSIDIILGVGYMKHTQLPSAMQSGLATMDLSTSKPGQSRKKSTPNIRKASEIPRQITVEDATGTPNRKNVTEAASPTANSTVESGPTEDDFFDIFVEHTSTCGEFFRTAETYIATDAAHVESTPSQLARLFYVFAVHFPSHKAYYTLAPMLTPIVLQQLDTEYLAYVFLATKLFVHAKIKASVHHDGLFQNIMREVCVAQSMRKFEGDILALVKALLADLCGEPQVHKLFDRLGFV